MKSQIKSVLNILIILASFQTLSAQQDLELDKPTYSAPTMGFSIRGNFSDTFKKRSSVTIFDQTINEDLAGGGYGPSLLIFKRINSQWIADLSYGFVFRASLMDDVENPELLRANFVVPLLLGLRYEFISAENNFWIRPYVSFGGGPYFTSEVKLDAENLLQQNAPNVNSTRAGAYLGGGADLKLGRNVALTSDLRYHLIDLPTASNLQSGLDFSMGLTFMRGS